MADDLVAAWRMSHEATTYLLGELPRGSLADRYDTRTRTVAAQFAHMHNVRVRFLRFVAPAVAKTVEPFPRAASPNKTELRKALRSSSKAVEGWFDGVEHDATLEPWKGPPATVLGYLVAHEAHHRGLALVALRQCGRKMPKEVVYGVWDWGKPGSLRG